MLGMMSRTAMMVYDFKDFPDQFPVRDPTCLVSASFTHKDVQAMHSEDAIDEADLAAPPVPPLTRSRAQSWKVPLPVNPSVPHQRLPHRFSLSRAEGSPRLRSAL
jgi:hypothetical protein